MRHRQATLDTAAEVKTMHDAITWAIDIAHVMVYSQSRIIYLLRLTDGKRPVRYDHAEVIRLKQDGLSHSQITARIGCSRASVTRILKGDKS